MDDYQLTKIQGGFVIRDNKGEGKYLYGISDEGNSFSLLLLITNTIYIMKMILILRLYSANFLTISCKFY